MVRSCYHDDINLETHQLGHKLREPIALPAPIGTRWRCSVLLRSPRSRRCQPNCLGLGGIAAASTGDRYPIRGTFFGCWASAGKLSAKSNAPSATRWMFVFIESLPTAEFRIKKHCVASVIPAQAGIQVSVGGAIMKNLDSRFHGNDG